MQRDISDGNLLPQLRVEDIVMQRNVLCVMLQEDAIVDANLRLEQWRDTAYPIGQGS